MEFWKKLQISSAVLSNDLHSNSHKLHQRPILLSVTPALYRELNSHLCSRLCYFMCYFLYVCTCTYACCCFFCRKVIFLEALRHICILTPPQEVFHSGSDILGPFTPSFPSPPFLSSNRRLWLPRGQAATLLQGWPRTILNPAQLAGFQQANLIFLNTGLCFSFITAGAGGESKGYRGKAQLIGLPEKPEDLNIKEE